MRTLAFAVLGTICATGCKANPDRFEYPCTRYETREVQEMYYFNDMPVFSTREEKYCTATKRIIYIDGTAYSETYRDSQILLTPTGE